MQDHNRDRFRVHSWFTAFIIFASWMPAVLAGPAPQFAFNINSSQVPGGLIPIAAGADGSGNIYISTLWYVDKLTAGGAYVTSWGGQGAGPGQFAYSEQSAFDQAGNIYVADSYNNRIEKFDSNGHFLAAWGSYGTGPGQFDYPDGVAVDGAGRVYVSDGGNSRIEVFTAGGAFLSQFGSAGSGPGQFSGPVVIATDSSNNLYVVDGPGLPYDNFRVQKFAPGGVYLTEWGSYGPNNANSSEIAGITTDPANNVYVSDASNNRIQKFASDGTFIAQWGDFGSGPGEFNSPMGIAVDPSGNYVYVADYYNARIEVFAYAAQAPLIYQPPTNQTVPAGVTLTLNVGVFGAQPLGYQWLSNGTNVPDATNSWLVISNVSLAASGSYSVLVSNSFGSAFSSNATVTVLPLVITTAPASSISATSAVLNGSAVLGSNPSTVWFEWGTNTSYGNVADLSNLSANMSLTLTQTLVNLSGALIYHYRLVGSNALGIAAGQDAQFRVGLAPTVRTLVPQPAGANAVTLLASVNPEARETTVFFRWGAGNPYQHNLPTNDIGSGVASVLVQTQLTGLASGVIYSVQPVASNELGVVSGSIANFVAPPWTLLTSSGPIWTSIAASADGHKLAAVNNGNIFYLWADAASGWTTNTLPYQGPWQTVTISADGVRLVAAASGGSSGQIGPVYFSTNSGAGWTKAAISDRNWCALAASADGLRVAGADGFGQRVLTSTNGGSNWSTNSPPILAKWGTLASSADGRRLIVAAGGLDNTTNGPLFTSTNAGLSWVSNNLPNQYWRSVASSADGQTLVAAIGGQHAGSIYISTNGGADWRISGPQVTNWQAVAVSADGTKVAAVARGEGRPLFLSSDSGQTWQSQQLIQATWSDVALSADGARVYISGDQSILSLQTTPSPRVETALAGPQLLLSWTIPSEPLVLQQASGISSSAWFPLTNTPVLVFTNLHYQVPVPAAGSDGFFRLAAP